MTLHHANQKYDSPIEVAKPYASYLAMFVGMGLISGSIVHAGQAAMRTQAFVLIAIGMVLFGIGSYVNEVIFKTGNVAKEGIFRYILFSLFLAMGIGMISGATQHFFDTPIYASYLAPAGVFISSLAFALRNNYELSRATWVKLIVAGLVFAGVFFALLNGYAKNLPVVDGHHGAAEVVAPHVEDGHTTDAVIAPAKTHNDGHTDADHQKK